MTGLEEHGALAAIDGTALKFQDAIARAGLPDKAPFEEWSQQILIDHPELKALVLPAGTVVEGDLHLDHDAEPFATKGAGCVVGLGDLTITGRIVNSDEESGPFLLVAGNLKAKELVAAASGIVVLGSVVVDGLILCDGVNGALLVGGDLKSATLIDCDHEILVAGDVDARVASDDLGNMRDLLVPDVFEDPADPANEWPEGHLIRERLLQGLPIFKT